MNFVDLDFICIYIYTYINFGYSSDPNLHTEFRLYNYLDTRFYEILLICL